MTRFIVGFIAIIVAGTILFGYTLPTYDHIQSLRAQNAQYDQALGNAKKLQTLKQTLLSKYNTFGGDQLERLNKLLPDHVDNVRLVLDLDSIASAYGIAVQNVVISRAEATPDSALGTPVLGQLGVQAEPYDSMTLQFSTQTTYPNFVAFMKDLEASLRIVDVTSLGMQEATGALGSEPLYRFSVGLKTYWLKK